MHSKHKKYFVQNGSQDFLNSTSRLQCSMDNLAEDLISTYDVFYTVHM